MEDKYIQFHLTEYSELIPAFMENIKNSYNSVMYGLLANAAIAAWISSNFDKINQRNILAISSLLPPLISFATWAFYVRRQIVADNIYKYLLTVEKKLACEGFGYLNFETKKYSKKYYIGTGAIFKSVCMLHSALTLYFAYFVWATL